MSEQDEKAVVYGREAAAVLGNRAYQDAYRVIEEGLVNELAKSDITDDRIKHLQMLLSLGRSYRKYFEKCLADGKFAAESIKQEEQRKRWFSRAA